MSRLVRSAFALLALACSAQAYAADPLIAAWTDSPDPVPAGGVVTYTATVRNPTLDAAGNVVITVPVPAGSTFVSATAPCTLSGGNVVCSLGTVNGNDADVRTLQFAFRATGPGPTSLTAAATLTADNDNNPVNNTQSQTTTVIDGGDLSLTKTGSPDPVVGGGSVTYTLIARNSGPNASGSVTIVDTLPPSSTYLGSAGTGWNCSVAGQTVTCVHAGTHPAGADLPALTLTARINASSGTVTNSATVSPSAGGTADPSNANNTATASTAVLPGADVRVTSKTILSGTPVIAGTDVTFQINPGNLGPATATGVVVTDTLPPGFTYVSSTSTGGGWSCSASGQTVTCTRAALAVGVVDNIRIVATAPSNATVGPSGAAYSNTGSITSAVTDPTPGNNAATVNFNVLPDGADLRLTKSKTPNPVAQGGALVSTINVTNLGPRVATGPLRVVEQLNGETFVSASGTGWTCALATATTLVCTHPNSANLAVGASLPALSIATTASSAGTLVNQACTGSTLPAGAGGGATASPPVEGDPNPGNDCASANANSTTTQPDLEITKLTSTPTGGDKIVSTSESSVTYTLTVRNVSATAQDATGVRVVDTVPAWINGRSSFASITATPSVGSTSTFSCGNSNATVTCVQTGGVLAQGESVTIVIVVNRPMSAGTLMNTATVSNTVEGDPVPTNNTAQNIVTIEPIADVEMTGKTVTPAAVRAGEQATYVLSYRNNGPSPALGVQVSDAFAFAPGDSGFTVVSIVATGSGTTCSIAAGAVLNPANPGFTCTRGTMANAETQSITVVVRPNFLAGNSARTVGNTATVSTTSVENPSGGDNGNNAQSATLTINPASVDLLVNKTDVVDPVPFATNAFLDYAITVTSNGPSFATGVLITENITPPAGKRVRFVCDVTAPGGATCNATPLCSVANVTSAPGTALPAFTCDVPAGTATTGVARGTLASGQTKSIWLRFEAIDTPAGAGDVFNNRVTVTSAEPDPFATNNTADEQTTVRQRIDLAVAKTASTSTVTLHQPFVWTVTVTNNGNGNSLQTDLTDTLPAGAVITGPITWTKTAPAGSGSCALVGVNVTCALGALDNAGVATISIPARVDVFPAGGNLTNTATVDTDPTKIGGVDPVPGNNSADHTITVTRASLGGTVFEDRDRAGANAGTPQAAGAEPRIAGVTITLTGTDAYGNAVTRTTTTDASGNYTFTDLPPSNGTGYTVTQTQPAGYANSPASPPTTGGQEPSLGGTYVPGGSTGNSSYTGVPVGGADTAARYNFPELRQPSLSGYVYVDVNGNGVRDAGTDLAIAGATVRLLNANTLAVVATATTNASGLYTFSGLDPLVAYTLEEPLPTTPVGLVNGPVNPGLVNGAACASGCTVQPNTPAANTDRIAAIDLSAGTDGTAFNFGEVQQTTISGLVFVDANRNNTLDGTDTGRLGGVTIRLVQGADCTSGTTLQTTTTAADGSYAFTGVAAFQNYLVCQTQPAGYGTGSANGTANSNVIALTNLPPAGSANNHFGETLGQISGSVYQDYSPATPANNDNGIRDAGELGIANVPVTITGTDILGNPVNRTTTTDASGNWTFGGLIAAGPGGYTVTEGAIPPASGTYADGRDTAGSLGGSTAVNDVISAIPLTAGTQAVNYGFGELPVAPISGTVYVDRNRNGAMDGTPTDGRIAGVTVRLVQGASCAAGTTVQTTTTDASGNWSFSGAIAGQNYLVCQTQPAGYGEGTTSPGAGNTTPAVDTIAITNLPAGGSSGNLFGERVGSLAGYVFLDANNDGARTGDAGIAGVTLTLTGTDAAGNAVTRTTTSDATGLYRFDDLLAAGPGGYTVTQQAAQPVVGGVTTLNGRTTAGTAGGTASAVATVPSAIAQVALGVAADATENNFGEILPASLAGTVFLDLDNNGQQNLPGDAGLANVTLVITGTDDTGAAVTRTVTTGANGTYSVPDLRPGTYTVTQPTQPSGTTNGQTVAGTAGGTASGVTTLPSAVSGVALGVGQASTANNFAELPAASISGTVIADANNNGVLDPGESGIAGVTLVLTGTDDTGTPVNVTVVTDASGNYSFPGLRPGTYTVTQPTQPPGTANGITTPGTVNGTPVGNATTPAQTPSAIGQIVIPPGANSVHNNFAEIGNSPDLLVAKSATETRFTVNNLGHYTIRVRNAGQAPTVGVYTVRDRLPIGLQLAAVPTGTGWLCVGAVGTQIITCQSNEPLAAGAANPNPISVIVNVTPPALQAAPVSNVVLVEGGGELPARGPSAAELDAYNNNPAALPPCDPAMTANACRVTTAVQASASISGTTWYDIGSATRVLDGGDRRLAGWIVEVLDAAGNLVGQSTTLADGTYRIDNLVPGEALHVRFRDPASNIVWAYPVNGESASGSSGAACNTAGAIASGTASSCAGTGNDPTLTVVLAPGQNLPQQSLPVDPSGVVYDSGNRQPVPGSVVTLQPVGTCAGWNPATSLVGTTLGGYTTNGTAVSMTVGADGFYQFLFAPAAPPSCTFQLVVTPPAAYTFVSTLIPPAQGPFTPGGAPGSVVAVQPNGTAPTGPVGPATTYYLELVSGSGSASIIHNHIPLDPATPTGLTLSKTGDRHIVEVGDSVRYTITVQRTSGPVPRQVTVVDRLPAGFTFIDGTAVVNGASVADPAGKPGPALVFNLGAMPASNQLVLQYRVRVGVGAMQGDGTNRATGYGCQAPTGCTTGTNPLPGADATNEGRHTVRVTGGVFTTDACVVGKIFVDCNHNHVQDSEEIGIPGVRLVISDGTTLVSDSEGKYSYCGLPPKSHVMRVDETTLPLGSRLTTSSNRNLGDAGSLWLDLKNGELHRADFIEGSCRAPVLDQVKARRAQGEIRSVEKEKPKPPALRFDSLDKDKGPWPRTQTPAPGAQEGGVR